MLWNKIFLEQPTVLVSDESRYLTPLWVSGNEEPRDEPYQSESSSSQSIITATDFMLQTENLFSDHQVSIAHKIRDALKHLSFREQHVLVQFWSPHQVGKHQLLTTIDQPFGVGVISEKLCFYRRDSEHNAFLVEKDHEEEDLSPTARVFRRGLPEWTSDLSNYNTKDFSQQDCAIRCNLHGYLALPVFDSTSGLCVGVLELLTSIKYTSYAVEVQQFHKALKAEHLLSPKAFNFPDPKVLCERRQIEMDKIKNILKNVCDVYGLPLAQTWSVSPFSSFVSNNKVIEKTCSRFDTRCIGKVCMSTTSLPFHVGDMHMWHFMKACRKLHLDKYSSYVGEALLARGSSYVQNVTELSEDEYPLVHYARMSGLTSCFTVFLHSVQGADDDDDYVLEFFLPLNNNASIYVPNLVETLKQNVEFASGFELGEISPLEFTSTSGSTSTDSSDSTTSTGTSMSTSTDSTTSTGRKRAISSWSPESNQMKRSRSVFDSNGSAISHAVYLLLKLKRWSCSIKKHGFSGKWWSCGKHCCLPFRGSCFIGAGSDTGSLTVKASFKDDMAKFRFLVSRGFVELKNEVVKRMENLKGKRFRLKYEDEDKDMVLIECDADLKFLSSNTTIKLVVEVVD